MYRIHLLFPDFKEVKMATTSFDKNFVVTDMESIKQLRADMKNPRKVAIKKYDREAENKKGIQLLKQRLPNLVNC